jgi:hypothetical protein
MSRGVEGMSRGIGDEQGRARHFRERRSQKKTPQYGYDDYEQHPPQTLAAFRPELFDEGPRPSRQESVAAWMHKHPEADGYDDVHEDREYLQSVEDDHSSTRNNYSQYTGLARDHGTQAKLKELFARRRAGKRREHDSVGEQHLSEVVMEERLYDSVAVPQAYY